MQRVNRLQRDNSITITGYIPLNRVAYRLANRNGLPRTAASQFLHMSFHVEPSGHHRIYCAINHGRQEGDGLIGRHASDRRFYVLIQKVESKKKYFLLNNGHSTQSLATISQLPHSRFRSRHLAGRSLFEINDDRRFSLGVIARGSGKTITSDACTVLVHDDIIIFGC